LDATLWYAIHEPDVDYPGIRTEQTEQGPREVLTCELGSKWADDVGRYTTSLDAALALAERVLPGWGWVLSTGARDQPAWVQAYPEPVDEDVCRDAVASASLPLALCAAILKATDTGRE
jgi:hypothetical protein